MYVLGVDFGGGSCKTTLLSDKGKVVATATCEYLTKYGSDGAATQNPNDWYFSACRNIKTILNQGYDPKDIKVVCFSAATHTAVLLDKNDQLICDALYWTDTRSKEEKKFLLEKYSDVLLKKTKHLPDTIWTLPELMYLFKNNKEIYKKVAKVMFEKDYVRTRFTGDFVTDYIEAEGSMMFDFDTKEWDKDLLSLCGLKINQMPKVVNPLDVVGKVCKNAAIDSGLLEGTKVICGSTDTAMEVFANGAIEKGDMTIKFATAGRVCVVSDALVSAAYLGPDSEYKSVWVGEADEFFGIAVKKGNDYVTVCRSLSIRVYVNGEQRKHCVYTVFDGPLTFSLPGKRGEVSIPLDRYHVNFFFSGTNEPVALGFFDERFVEL